MPHTVPYTDEECIEALRLVEQYGTAKRASEASGVQYDRLLRLIKKAYARGLHDDAEYVPEPGLEIVKKSVTMDAEGEVRSMSFKTSRANEPEFEMPAGYLLEKGTYQVDGDGQIIQQWLKTRKDAPEISGSISAIQQAVAQVATDGIKLPKVRDHDKALPDMLNLRPLPDLHMGLYAHHAETETDWDLKIALAKYKDTMLAIDEMTLPTEQCVVLGGGDLVHADNRLNRTERSGNVLDVDTRYDKVLEETLMLMVFQVELARRKHKEVLVRFLKGNHDPHACSAVTWFLWGIYKDVPNVTVDTSPNEFWFKQFGRVMLAANHGHDTKLTQMPMVMANRRKEMWGMTDFRYAHGFHIHHKTQHVFEDGGVVMESHQAPVPSDTYHYNHSYLSGRSLQAINYHIEKGEKGRVTEPVI